MNTFSNPPCFLTLLPLQLWCLDFFLSVSNLVCLSAKWGQHRTERFLRMWGSLCLGHCGIQLTHSRIRSHVPVFSHVIVPLGEVGSFLYRSYLHMAFSSLAKIQINMVSPPHGFSQLLLFLTLFLPAPTYSALVFFFSSWKSLPWCPPSSSSHPAPITHMSSWKRLPHCSTPASRLHHSLCLVCLKRTPLTDTRAHANPSVAHH